MNHPKMKCLLFSLLLLVVAACSGDDPVGSTVSVKGKVTVDGKPLPPRECTRLFLYHKPRGLMTTHADPEGRPTVFDNLPEGLPRLISIGRLDFNTEGLLLLTNDGGLARALELPDTGWLRRYRVRAHVAGSFTQPPAQAEAMYQPGVKGASGGQRIAIAQP